MDKDIPHCKVDSGRGKLVKKLAVIDLLRGHSTVQGAVRRPREEGNPFGNTTISNSDDVMR